MTNPTQIQPKPFLPALTGLRAIAAYMVFLCHNPIECLGKTVYEFCCQFFIGVSIFFIMSGFLITIRYEKELMHTGSSIFTYFRNRIARIYPMFFLVTTFTFWYGYHYNITDKLTVITAHPLFTYLGNITLAKGFFNNLAFTGIVQSWTLTTEECFYALAPLIFLLSKKIKPYLQVVLLYFIGLSLWVIFRNIKLYGFFDDLNFIYMRTFYGRCIDFYVGMQLAKWYNKKEQLPFIEKNYTLIGSVLILATLILFLLTRSGYKYAFYSVAGVAINNFILPIAVAIFFWGLLKENTWFNKLLQSKLFSILGKSSFSFYLIHMGVINDIIVKHITGETYLNFPILVVLSIVLYKCVEQPLQHLIKRKSE